MSFVSQSDLKRQKFRQTRQRQISSRDFQNESEALEIVPLTRSYTEKVLSHDRDSELNVRMTLLRISKVEEKLSETLRKNKQI